MANPPLAAALKAAGVTDGAAFRQRFGVGLVDLTPAEAVTLLTRPPLLTIRPPKNVNAEDWEQVCAIVDAVLESPPSSTIGCPIGRYTRSAAARINHPAATGEDLHTFARRFERRVRQYTLKELQHYA